MKVIGIVMMEKDDARILRGYLAELKEGILVEAESTIKLNNEIVKTYFTLNKVEKRYSVAGGSKEVSEKVGKELQKLGYTGLKFIYNEQLILIDSESNSAN